MDAVLIETYWNVKEKCSRLPQAWLSVLIETYWNVKTGQASGGCTDWFPVLIETYWNVNMEVKQKQKDNQWY